MTSLGKDLGSEGRDKHSRDGKRRRNLVKEMSCVGVDIPWDIICNILSRLPVKSLFRFRAVAKIWYNVIQDPYFIDLHFSNIHFHQDPYGILLFENENRGLSKTYYVDEHSPYRWDTKETPFKLQGGDYQLKIEATCDGLLCLSNNFNSGIYNLVVYNPITGKGVILQDLFCQTNRIYFGCDENKATFKVVVVMRVSAFVITVGESCWRRLDIPEVDMIQHERSIYFNGEFYWILNGPNNDFSRVLVMNVCDEMFKVITYHPNGLYPKHDFYLFNCGSHVGMLAKTADYGKSIVQISILADSKRGIWHDCSTVMMDDNIQIFKVVSMVDNNNLLLQIRKCASSQDMEGMKRYVLYNLETGTNCVDFIGARDIPRRYDALSYQPSLISPMF